MRVVCIDEKQQGSAEGPSVKRGNLYTVIDVLKEDNTEYEVNSGWRAEKGDYYILAEIGDQHAFHTSLFLQINEDQKDETEMERESTKELFTEEKAN